MRYSPSADPAGISKRCCAVPNSVSATVVSRSTPASPVSSARSWNSQRSESPGAGLDSAPSRPARTIALA